MNVCAQVHKRIRRINVRRQGYKSDLLLLNSDINERNNRKSCLNLVFPRLKCEIERGGGRTFGVRATRLWKAVPNSLKKFECVHSLIFKKTLIGFYASS